MQTELQKAKTPKKGVCTKCGEKVNSADCVETKRAGYLAMTRLFKHKNCTHVDCSNFDNEQAELKRANEQIKQLQKQIAQHQQKSRPEKTHSRGRNEPLTIGDWVKGDKKKRFMS